MKSKRQRKVARARRGKTTAANLIARHDAGEDVSDYFDSAAARRRNRKAVTAQQAAFAIGKNPLTASQREELRRACDDANQAVE